MRGCLLTPQSKPIIKCPSDVLVTKNEMFTLLKRYFKHPSTPLVLAKFTLRMRTLSSAICNHTKMANAIQLGSLPCVCEFYPHLPRRGGHVWLPSWLYCGP